jgi:predicted DNA-binding transcriptional regulator AlpA
MMTSTNNELPAKPRTRDVCRWLGVQPITVYRWRNAKAFPEPTKLGGTKTLFYDRDELLAWAAGRR